MADGRGQKEGRSAAPARARRNLGKSGFARLIKVHQYLANEKRTTAAWLAKQLEVSERTIKRDIDDLRDQHGAEIRWDAHAGTYCLDKPAQLPLLQVTAEEAVALELAGTTFAAWKGRPLGEALASVLKKLAQVVGETLSVPAESLQSCLYQPSNEEALRVQNLIPDLVRAIQERRRVAVTYRKPGATADEVRQVEPLRLAYLDHDWILVAQDLSKGALRNFLLGRIVGFESGTERFTPPEEGTLKAYLAGSVGRFSGGKFQTVVLLFDRVAAPYVMEKPWHPSQKAEWQADGRLRVTLQVNHLGDVQRALLAWGVHGEALEPAELRKAVAEQVSLLAEKYFGKSKGSDNA